MAIVNASPDSFSGPTPLNLDDLAQADILDVGGESTRPGAVAVSPQEEQRRILPVIAALLPLQKPISVDTRNAATMAAALDAGASIVNDVSGLTHDPQAATLVAARGCRVILMHMRGTPQTMQTQAHYDDVVSEVKAELAERIQAAEHAGILRKNIAIDPGIGFAKTLAQNLELLKRLSKFSDFGLPILIGVSRKSFIGHYGEQPDATRRTPGSIAAALFALTQGATILRVHDVAETAQAVKMWQALTSASDGSSNISKTPTW